MLDQLGQKVPEAYIAGLVKGARRDRFRELLRQQDAIIAARRRCCCRRGDRYSQEWRAAGKAGCCGRRSRKPRPWRSGSITSPARLSARPSRGLP